MKRIICIGNRYLSEDAAGPRVFDYLAGLAMPGDVELIDGGIAGLNLLGLVDGAERVVFVDAVSGIADRGVVVLPAAEVPAPSTIFDHAAGVQYLISIIPHVCESAPDDLYLVGIEGEADRAMIAEAAQTSMRLAAHGFQSAGNDLFTGGSDERVH